MSKEFILLAARLAQAVVEERRMARMMCECPPDDIDNALDEFVKLYSKIRKQNSKELPEIK